MTSSATLPKMHGNTAVEESSCSVVELSTSPYERDEKKKMKKNFENHLLFQFPASHLFFLSLLLFSFLPAHSILK